jgi:hypothetical protein
VAAGPPFLRVFGTWISRPSPHPHPSHASVSTQVALSGTGLSSSALVTLGGAPCVVDGSANTSRLVCATGASLTGGPAVVPLLYNGASTGLTFEYSTAFTPLVASFSPASFSLAVSQVCVGLAGPACCIA